MDVNFSTIARQKRAVARYSTAISKRVARNTPSFCTELMGPPTPVQNGTHVQTTTYDDITAWTHLQNRFFTVRQALCSKATKVHVQNSCPIRCCVLCWLSR